MVRYTLLALCLVAACDDPAGGRDTDAAPPSDTGTPTAEAGADAAGGADASPPADAGLPDAFLPVSCECEADETCQSCFEHIGQCCYGDPTLGAEVARITAACEAQGACRACCRECEGLSCDELVRSGSCPNLFNDEPIPEPGNGLTLNGDPLQSLAADALSAEALSENEAFLAFYREQGWVPGLFKYLVQCALKAEQELRLEPEPGGEPVVLTGGLGLAPEWAMGPCDEACQEWVSACLFARTNTYGLPVRIYMSGPHPAFIAEAESDGLPAEAGFGEREGAFYGNYFLPLPREHACRGDGYDPLYMSVRVCATSGAACGFNRVGTCGDTDGDTGQPSPRHACEAENELGDYLRCHDRASLPGEAGFPEPSRVYEQVVTVHVRPSAFRPGIEAACDQPPLARPEGPVDPGPARTGAPCDNNDDCDSETLHCDVRGLDGYCTAACEPRRIANLEASQCGGPGTTCLSWSGQGGLCTSACRPGAAEGDDTRCPAGQLCSTGWLLNGGENTPGCAPFCDSDADCPPGLRCNERLGGCGGPVDETALPDGEPCDFREGLVCRGACFVVGDEPHEGLCASLLNAAARQECPDDPATMRPAGPGFGTVDDLGVCLYRACEADADCTESLRCLDGVLDGGKVCTWPP